MQSEELRALTASELLTLQEEYEMQQKWILDDDSTYRSVITVRELLQASVNAATSSHLSFFCPAYPVRAREGHKESIRIT